MKWHRVSNSTWVFLPTISWRLPNSAQAACCGLKLLRLMTQQKKNCKMYVHAVTSKFNQTVYDSHVNLLRSMTETMSAALAGVDSLETLPFDQLQVSG